MTQITETEMRDFFNRLISSMVESSRTHQELEALKTRFSETEERVTRLVSELSNVRSELYRTVAERDQARKEVEEYKGLSESYSRDLDHTKKELEAISTSHADLAHRLADTQKQLDQAQANAKWWEETSKSTENDRQYWRKRAFDAEEARDINNDKFVKLNDKFEAFERFMSGLFDKGPKVIEHKPEDQSPLSGAQLSQGVSSSPSEDKGPFHEGTSEPSQDDGQEPDTSKKSDEDHKYPVF